MSSRKSLWVKVSRQSIFLIGISMILALGINQFRPDGIPLIGDWSPENRIVTEAGESLVISLEDAKALFETGNVIFLDARPASEYESGHIQGALNLPWQEFDDYFDQVWQNIPENKTVIAYCDGETCELSKDLARALKGMGIPDVRVLVNGWSLWKNQGLPVSGGEQS